jgi:hypothetical protein
MNTTQTATDGKTLETNLLRALALMQHNGDDFFIVDGKAYEGTEADAKESYEAAKEDYETFSDFCESECNQVEEIDVDDYNSDYLVLTDEEADEKWEESLDNYIEECITPEIDKIAEGQGNLSYYIKFDKEMWKRDARFDGRGHSLSSYDGNENEETVNGQTFYIYRLN